MKNTLKIIIDQQTIVGQLTDNNNTELWYSETPNLLNACLPIEKNIAQFLTQYNSSLNQLQQISFIHDHNINTWVPNEFFSENHLADYLKLNAQTLSTETICSDYSKTLHTHNVYAVSKQTLQAFPKEQTSISTTHLHSATALLELAFNLHQRTEIENIAIFRNNKLFLSIFHNNRLQFVNTFDIDAHTDILYYILFTWEQFNISPEEGNLLLTGDIRVQPLLEKYIQTITTQDELNSETAINKKILQYI